MPDAHSGKIVAAIKSVDLLIPDERKFDGLADLCEVQYFGRTSCTPTASLKEAPSATDKGRIDEVEKSLNRIPGDIRQLGQ